MFRVFGPKSFPKRPYQDTSSRPNGHVSRPNSCAQAGNFLDVNKCLEMTCGQADQWKCGVDALQICPELRESSKLQEPLLASGAPPLRPQVLLMCKTASDVCDDLTSDAGSKHANPDDVIAHPSLLRLLAQLKGGRGLVILGSIVKVST